MGFLRAEYGRLGVEMPPLPGLCTLHLAHKLLPEAPSRNLRTCCYQLGVRHEDEHVAHRGRARDCGDRPALPRHGSRARDDAPR
ncbi:MAG: hypothetical protein KJ067_07125 [Vicinamibacteria bacterium]|nr:hypothetical protein [Vicinamibacteria bacterium]